LFENQTEKRFKIKLEDSEFTIEYVIKCQYKIFKDSIGDLR
jgi:hypothetical protein